jgi:hypothetical protein
MVKMVQMVYDGRSVSDGCQIVVRWCMMVEGVIRCRMLILRCYILLLLTYSVANYVYKNITLYLTLQFSCGKRNSKYLTEYI